MLVDILLTLVAILLSDWEFWVLPAFWPAAIELFLVTGLKLTASVKPCLCSCFFLL